MACAKKLNEKLVNDQIDESLTQDIFSRHVLATNKTWVAWKK